MGKRWIWLLGTPVGRALGWEPKSWLGLVVSSVLTIAAVFVVDALFGWYDFRRDPVLGLVLAVCLIGGQAFAFVRDRRPDDRDAERRDTQARADRSKAG